MERRMGLTTTNGLPIYSFDHVQRQRALFSMKKTRDYIAQPGGQENSLIADADIVITGGNRGGGKANTYFTDVIVPTGTVKMGDLKIGDPICTPYEGIQFVEAIFEQGVQRAYRFYFDDNTSMAVMDNHRFVARISPDSPFQEMTAREIMDRYRLGMEAPTSLRKGITCLTEIPLCDEVKFCEQVTEYDLPWHPYILGIISSAGRIRITSNGADVNGFNPRVKERVERMGYTWHHSYRTNHNFIRGFTNEQKLAFFKTRGGSKGIFTIPKQYKTACVSARWELLHGILDIGATTWKGTICLTGYNRKYLEDVAWIARSLGVWCKLERTRRPEEHCLWFRAPDDDDLFYAGNRKNWGNKNGEKASSLLPDGILTKKIIHIKKCDEKVKCRCIQVSGKDHLYLTDAFSVNHNTVMLLMNPMYYVNNPSFNGLILRKEKGDLDNIIRESNSLYSEKGDYKASYMRWDMRSGAQILFSYFTGSYDDFKDRMQGRQYAYIGVDEITQIDYEKFKYLITSNRNGSHIRNRFLGTCNPDPTSWVRKFIDWWIGEDGYPIPNRNGVVRYCFMGGDTPEDIVWGNSRIEVYEKIKDKIDALVDERDSMSPEYMYVKSVVFVRAELDDNRALLESSPEYKANLAQQSDEQRERDFKGNWNFMSMGNDLVKMIHMLKCFQNPEMRGDGKRRCSIDVAFEGGDSCVMWLWIGWHVADLFVCHLDSQTTVAAVRTKLEEWRVHEEDMVYDLQGVGQVIKGFFKKALPFNNQESVDEKYKGMYDTKKSQCAFMFADKLIQGEISFEPSILTRKFSGKNFKNLELREILMQERKILRADASKADRGKCLISKDQMKSGSIIGRSPDFMESLLMIMLPHLIAAKSAEMPNWVRRMAGGRGCHIRRLS